jgi:hypothetical protein
MSERADLFCGCAYVKAGPKWYQVVACPDHVMDLKPHDEVPAKPELRP